MCLWHTCPAQTTALWNTRSMVYTHECTHTQPCSSLHLTFSLFYAFGCFACMYVSALCVCLVPREARRGKWSYRKLWVITMWMLGVDPESFGRASEFYTAKPSSQPPLCHLYVVPEIRLTSPGFHGKCSTCWAILSAFTWPLLRLHGSAAQCCDYYFLILEWISLIISYYPCPADTLR
jgi:hypothetical protein